MQRKFNKSKNHESFIALDIILICISKGQNYSFTSMAKVI